VNELHNKLHTINKESNAKLNIKDIIIEKLKISESYLFSYTRNIILI